MITIRSKEIIAIKRIVYTKNNGIGKGNGFVPECVIGSDNPGLMNSCQSCKLEKCESYFSCFIKTYNQYED